MRRTIFLTVLSLLILCFGSFTVRSQQIFKTTSTSVIGYLEYVPEDYKSNSDKYPVVIFLHGKGERGANSTDPAVLSTTIQNVAKLGPPMYVKNGTQFPFILISPQLKNNYGAWPTWYVLEVINHIKSYLRIDEKRILLTGLSMGGGGVWMTAQDNAELFAAIAPVCGGQNTLSKACNIASENLPVWAFHGDADTIVPMSKSINMVNAINACTPTPAPLAKITIYPGVGHSAWSKAYKTDNSVHNPNMYQWMMSSRNTVNKGNKIPVAGAGADKSISLSNSTVINGSGTDEDGSIASYSWTQISGPSTATLTNNLTNALTASKLVTGEYMFRFTVKDNSGNTDSDYVKLIVTESNATPTVSAGADKSITLPTNAVSITGTATDPDGTIAAYAWSKVSGATATLSGTSTANLNASNLVEGSYVFRFTATDNKGAKKSDDVAVTVKSTTVNIAPVANAGVNMILYYPSSSVTITGTGTDADGTISAYKWTKVKGGSATLSGVTTPILSVSGMVVGSYYFRLTVTDDKGATHYDDMLVTVKDPVTSSTSFEPRPLSTAFASQLNGNTAIDEAFSDPEIRRPVLGKLSLAQLENSTVAIFNDSGEKLFSGTWGNETFHEVLNKRGLYIYNVIREGKRAEAGKIYVRD